MLSRALRSCQSNTRVAHRLFFNFAPKVNIPEDPTSKPNVLLKLMGLYSKDSVLPRQAKKLYTAAKEQARILFEFDSCQTCACPLFYTPLPFHSESAPPFLWQCWN